MPYKFIKLNRAKCLLCKEIIISPPDKADKEISCSCGSLTISGGATAFHVRGKKGTYEKMCIMDFSGCPEVSTDTPSIPPPGSTITRAEIEERKRKIKK